MGTSQLVPEPLTPSHLLSYPPPFSLGRWAVGYSSLLPPSPSCLGPLFSTLSFSVQCPETPLRASVPLRQGNAWSQGTRIGIKV